MKLGRKPAEAKKFQMSPDFSTALQEWCEAEATLIKVKAREFELRQRLVKDGFDATKLEGTETIELANGWKLKAVKDQNYSLTNKQQETSLLLDAIGNNGHPDIAIGLVRWQPELSKTTYKELLKHLESIPNCRALLSAALTIKPGAPQLELVPPEAPKPQ